MYRLRGVLAGLLLGMVLALFPIAIQNLPSEGVRIQFSSASAQETGCDDGTTGSERNCTLAERISDPSGYVYQSWVVMRGIINIILVIALLAISFSNITRINIDTYTIKKALPNLLIGVVLANASLFIIRYIADLSTVTIYFFVEQAGKGTFTTFLTDTVTAISVESFLTLGIVATAIAPLLLLIIGLIVVVGVLWLALVLYVRLAVIYLLTILAPVAFVAYGIPGMDKYFKQWWQQFTKWMFILPAMSAVFWLILLIQKSGEQSLVKVVTMYVLFFFALAIPSKFGGSIVDKTTAAFKKYSGTDAARKAAGEYASLKGQQIGYRMPGVARYQAWREQQKANAEKDIEQLKKRGRNKIRRGKAGLNEKKLELLDKEIAADEREVTSIQGRAARSLRDRHGDTLGLREVKADYRARKAEAMDKAKSSEDRFNYINTNKEEMQALFREVINEEVLAEGIKRQEGILKGDEGGRFLQALRLRNDFGEDQKDLTYLEEERQAAAQAGQDTSAIVARIDGIKKDQAKREASFKELIKDPIIKGRFDEVSVSNTAQGLTLSDVQSHYESNDQFKQLVGAEYKQLTKSFNEGIAAQFEQDIKEKTIPALDRDLKNFVKETFGNNAEDAHAFIKGDFAGLVAKGYDYSKLRSGIGTMEVYKQVMKRPGEIRHGAAMQSIAAIHDDLAGKIGATKISDVSPQLVTDMGGNQNQRRAASNWFIENLGGLSGQASQRVQQVDLSSYSGGGLPTYSPPNQGGGQQGAATPGSNSQTTQANTAPNSPPTAPGTGIPYSQIYGGATSATTATGAEEEEGDEGQAGDEEGS